MHTKLFIPIILSFLSIRCHSQIDKSEKKIAIKTHFRIIKSVEKKDTFLIQKDLNYDSFIIEKIFHDIDEFSFQIFKKNGAKLISVSEKIETGSFYDTIFIKDYNFDGKLDIDLVSRPANRSGDNAINHILLRKGNYFIQAVKSETPLCAYITPVKSEKALYGRILNGNGGYIFRKLIWENNKLVITEEVTSYCKKSCTERIISKYLYKKGTPTLIKTEEINIENYDEIIKSFGMDSKIKYWD